MLEGIIHVWQILAELWPLTLRIFIRATKVGRTIMVWVVRLSVCLSVGLSAKACKQDTDRTVKARAVNFGTHTCYDKRTTPIVFQGQGSKVKVTLVHLYTKACKQDTG